jgi:2-oxoglutarate/2-oxoacid ferredoxin oxidoreductase subunit beta
MGSVDHPFNPISLALGAEATFVGRALDSDRKSLTEVLGAAAAHRGSALVEIFQDCPIFNDGSFDLLRKPETKDQRLVAIRDGEPIVFGPEDNRQAVVQEGFTLKVVPAASLDERGATPVVHDAANHELAFALSRLSDQDLNHTVTGIFRNVERTTYDDAARAQVTQAKQANPIADLQTLLNGRDTWTITS